MIRPSVHKEIHLYIQRKDDTALEMLKNEAFNLISKNKLLRQSGLNSDLQHSDIEKAIELIVKIEAYQNNLGWFKRMKRRLSLVKEFS